MNPILESLAGDETASEARPELSVSRSGSPRFETRVHHRRHPLCERFFRTIRPMMAHPSWSETTSRASSVADGRRSP